MAIRFDCLMPFLKEDSKVQAHPGMACFVQLRQKRRVFKISPGKGGSHIQLKFSKLRMSRTDPSASEVVVDDDKEEKGRINKSEDITSEGSHESSANVKGKTKSKEDDDGSLLMTDEERLEFRKKIREVIDMNPEVEEELDPVEKRKKMEKLLAEYPLVVDEEDPDWPEDADGWGFKLGQFFDKITIKNVKKEDDEDYDSDKEIVWKDDNYIRPIKDITTKEWEEAVFKDISPLVILVHNRYKRPQENENFREELERGVQIFWDSRLPSPRCVAIDAVVETDLVFALGVSIFPELIFTKAGKILYREKAARTAEELSKIMAFFYYGANRPPWFNYKTGSSQEQIPPLT